MYRLKIIIDTNNNIVSHHVVELSRRNINNPYFLISIPDINTDCERKTYQSQLKLIRLI